MRKNILLLMLIYCAPLRFCEGFKNNEFELASRDKFFVDKTGLIEKMNSLQEDILKTATESNFDNFKVILQDILKEISQTSKLSYDSSTMSLDNLRQLAELISGLNINLKLLCEKLTNLLTKPSGFL